MNMKKTINDYIDDLEYKAKQSDKFFVERNELYIQNQELKKQLEIGEQQYNDLVEELNDANEKIILLQASEPMLNYKKSIENAQQKEFIKYLEDNWKQTQDIWYIKILQKYKSIIGDKDEELSKNSR